MSGTVTEILSHQIDDLSPKLRRTPESKDISEVVVDEPYKYAHFLPTYDRCELSPSHVFERDRR